MDRTDLNEVSRLLADRRVLITHDWLVTWGGAERCVEQMLNVIPHADIVVGVRARDFRADTAMSRRAVETWLGRLPGAQAHHRWFVPVEAVAFATLDTKRYDVVISSSHTFSKAVRVRSDAVHLCYCYSPPRYLWDLRNMYRRDARRLQRVALAVGSGLLRRLDRWAARRVRYFAGISRYVAARIRRSYGRDAIVIYPPVEPKPGGSTATIRGDFLLSLGRLVPYKRVDLAILAAERLGVPIVVAGDGPDRRRLERLAGPMTTFVGAVGEIEAGRLLSQCRAFVFCAEEDFGIAPLEANAHGTPVVGYGVGGLLETMVPGETAEYFERQDPDAVAHAIQRALSCAWREDLLRANAGRFTPGLFRKRFRAWVEGAVLNHDGVSGDVDGGPGR